MKTEMHVARTLVVAMLLFSVAACNEEGSGEGLKASARFNDEARAEDVGLPDYPGSTLYKAPGESSSGANVGLSTPLFGLKVAAVKLESADRPERVAKFYRKALSRYGDLLDCSDGAATAATAAASGELKCDPADPGEHSFVYKVGSEKNQRIVAIKPHGKGSQFDLVHVSIRD